MEGIAEEFEIVTPPVEYEVVAATGTYKVQTPGGTVRISSQTAKRAVADVVVDLTTGSGIAPLLLRSIAAAMEAGSAAPKAADEQESTDRILKSVLPAFLEIAQSGPLVPFPETPSPSRLRLKRAIADVKVDIRKRTRELK